MSEADAEKASALSQLHNQLGPATRPIVLKIEKTKKKKSKSGAKGGARYSPELRDVQLIGTDALHAAHRAASAFVKGLDTYERERLKSANEKKDGAIEDFVYNAGKAASVWMKETSDIPVDLAESVRPRLYPKRLRKNLRKVSKMIRNGRM